MTTREVPRHQWREFFDRVSRLHVAEPVHVEVFRPDLGAQLEVARLPFEGISVDLKDGENSITIAAGTSPDDHIAHLIADPQQVWVLCGVAGDEEVIEIRAADLTTTLLHFDAPRGWSLAERDLPGVARGLLDPSS